MSVSRKKEKKIANDDEKKQSHSPSRKQTIPYKHYSTWRLSSYLSKQKGDIIASKFYRENSPHAFHKGERKKIPKNSSLDAS